MCMVIPLAVAGANMARRGIVKKVAKSKVGKAVGKALGFGGKGVPKKKRWTPEKGMKSLMKAKIQGQINKEKYGWMMRK